ncbi:MAG: glycosyltransferase family 4 protein [Elusimicrobia bacterium]|nr:glycosyltransferase family 4 protein [Elusimicrobiota bacterium]
MIKILHLITQLELGGAQQNTLYTVRHLDPKLFRPHLAYGPGGILDPETQSLPVAQSTVPHLGRPIRPLQDLLALLEIYRILRKERPQILHTHSSKAGILGRWAAHLAGVPCRIHTYHGFGFNPRQQGILRRLLIFLERRTARITQALIFVSRENREEAQRLRIATSAQHHLIRSGIDLARFPAGLEKPDQKRAELGAASSSVLITSVGNFKPQKNPQDFLELARRILPRHPAARFLFIGNGPGRPRLERFLAQKGLTEKVRLLGWRRDVPEILAVTDLFVLTSLWEGLPRSLVEAMASGVACAAYAVGGIGELIEEGTNGYTACPQDLNSLTQKVSKLIADPELRKTLGGNAKKSISQEFDIRHMVRRQEELYQKLLQTPSPTSCIP